MVEIKFCGMTRAEDARLAAEVGAAYVGVVFAGGPRAQDVDSAAAIFGAVPHGVRRVGVFGGESPARVARDAERLGLDVVQLHGDPTSGDVLALRRIWSGRIWAAVRVAGSELPPGTAELFAAADAVVLDARVEGALGGTGVALSWADVAGAVREARAHGGARLVVAGGLRPENVARAVSALRPDVVDVSSGVEQQVGVKDPARMRAFRDAVRSVEEGR